MDNKITLPKESLSKLRCSTCKGYLSVPPIKITKGQMACGRCSSSGVRVKGFEVLAKFMIFPCMYEDCGEKLSWGKVENHEEQCAHRTIVCPFMNCAKQYNLKVISQHFQESHKEFVHSNQFISPERKLVPVSKKNFKYDRKLYLVMTKAIRFLVFVYGGCTTDESKENITSYNYSFGVYYINKKPKGEGKFEVTLTLSSDNGSMALTNKNQIIEKFDDTLHCLVCIQGNCPIKTHKKSNNFLTTKFENIQKQNNMTVSYSVKICGEPEQQQQPTEPDNSELAKKLECPICSHYMCAPIFICANGHSICDECKKRIVICPFCKASIGTSRNYILEDISQSVKIPCQNNGKGCRFVGSVGSVKRHEVTCLK